MVQCSFNIQEGQQITGKTQYYQDAAMVTGAPEEARVGPYHHKGESQESKNGQAEEVAESSMKPTRQVQYF